MEKRKKTRKPNDDDGASKVKISKKVEAQNPSLNVVAIKDNCGKEKTNLLQASYTASYPKHQTTSY